MARLRSWLIAIIAVVLAVVGGRADSAQDKYVLQHPNGLAFKEAWRDRVITVFPRQGQYARDAKAYRSADLTVERIGDLLAHDLPELLSAEVPS
jgi:hypothetical protein